MKKYKYILFDWDGCLAKTLQVWMKAYKTVFAEYGVYPSEQEIGHHFGDWEGPKYFGIKDVEGCIKKIDEIAGEELKKVALYEDARKLLEKLKGNKSLALLSSSPREILNAAVKHNNLTDYFEVVLAGEDVKNHKPHPEVIEKGLQMLKGAKSKAIIIGDSRKDLEAANNAEIDSILVYPQSHSLFYKFEELKAYKPTYIVNNLSEILRIIK